MKYAFVILGIFLVACTTPVPYDSDAAGGTFPAGTPTSELCTDTGGVWIDSAQECEGITAELCQEMGGQFNECASACRNDPDAEICTAQCVQVCAFGNTNS